MYEIDLNEEEKVLFVKSAKMKMLEIDLKTKDLSEKKCYSISSI